MQKMQEHFSALHCPNTRHPWRNVFSAFVASLQTQQLPKSNNLPCCRHLSIEQPNAVSGRYMGVRTTPLAKL
ncbi:hypothetical protein [Methylotuvimicrobium alcaliphilum]|uniref:hypothetical protein n=1 Tax=Methylotuvimicrobium alcaliphilum TaxID=271065 RepID=UPI0002E07DAE|nr:hypothetical protein [Methylotuvimicrobium alcaliphilum]